MHEYIATLKNGLSLTPEIKAYFLSQQIHIKKHYPRLGIVKIYAKQPLETSNLLYLENLELERVFEVSSEEE